MATQVLERILVLRRRTALTCVTIHVDDLLVPEGQLWTLTELPRM